eukprot:7289890-Prymnesium_polylepis.1
MDHPSTEPSVSSPSWRVLPDAQLTVMTASTLTHPTCSHSGESGKDSTDHSAPSCPIRAAVSSSGTSRGATPTSAAVSVMWYNSRCGSNSSGARPSTAPTSQRPARRSPPR